MTDLTIAGRTFRVDATGEPTRPPLMLSNSLGTDLTMWDGQLPVLTKHFRVIRYDARGFGGSAALPDKPASIADLGADVIAILDALEIERTDWLGLSMGGAIGLWLLVNAPTRIRRAVLANTAPKLGSPETWNARIAMVLSGGIHQNADATIERWFSPNFAERVPDRVEAISSTLRSASPKAYATCCAALRDMDFRECLRGISHDVLVITGRDDPVIPSKEAAAMTASMARAKTVVLNARHMSNIEAEADFNAAVIDFLVAPSADVSRPKTTSKAPTRTRGGAKRRSNAARNPLNKTPAKPLAAPKPGGRAKKGKSISTRRTPAKTSATRRGAPKSAIKKAPAKATRKTATARRPTPVTAARSPVKRIKPRSTPAKASTKKVAKKPIKKIAAARRRPTTKPRRPSGRRKR